MSAPQPPEAAVEAAKEALRGYTGVCICDAAYTSRRLVDPSCAYHDMEGAHSDILTAAYPHLRRAIIAELIAKAETELAEVRSSTGNPFWAYIADDLNATIDWLRAELEEGDRE